MRQHAIRIAVLAAGLLALCDAHAQTAGTAAPAAGTGAAAGTKPGPDAAPAVGSGSGASTGAGLPSTGGLGAAGGPATGAAAESTNDPRMAKPKGGQ